jgi:hypothetical protein
MDISVSSALLQSSSFEITSGQWISKILRRQRLTNTCSFEIVVFATFHVSELYSNTDLHFYERTLSRAVKNLYYWNITADRNLYFVPPKYESFFCAVRSV